MKNYFKKLAVAMALAAVCPSGYAGVTYSLDGTTTTASTAFPGAPVLTLAAPNVGNVYESGGANGGVEGIAFLATSSFILGAVEFQAASGGENVSISLYNLGPSFVPVGGGGAAQYTITGSSVNLFTAGLNATVSPSGDAFHVLTFSGADQVSIASGNWYVLELLDNDVLNNLQLRRASSTLNTFLSIGTGATGTRNNVAAGDRDPVGALYAVVPEPSVFAIGGLGLLALLAVRRGRHTA